jgi:putative DNA primase/helicase
MFGVAREVSGMTDLSRADGIGRLSWLEYDLRRKDLAEDLGVSLKSLDAEYRDRRKMAKEEASDFLRDPDPWPDQVTGDCILAEIAEAAVRHLVLPDGCAEVIALWTLFAHCHDYFSVSPMLVFTSPTPECGKTTCMSLLKSVTPRALAASSISPSSVFRSMERWHPTLLIDEADTFIRDNDELRGILNASHYRSGAFVIRTVGDDHEPKQFCTWGPKAVALIGKLPPTLASRSIRVALKRMLPGDRIEPLREGRTEYLQTILRKAIRWAQDHAHELRDAADPVMPESLYGRAADNWRPLMAIADLVGGDWPARVRQIAETLSGRSEDLASIMILHDVAALFEARSVDRLSSEEIVAGLLEMEGRPWPEWGKNQKPITKNQLAKLLDPHAICPNQHKTALGKDAQGLPPEGLG